MGAYNEGPCLGQVTVEHSPNSTHPSFAPFAPPPPSFPLFSQSLHPLSLLYATVYPQRSSDPVCPLAPLPALSLLSSLHLSTSPVSYTTPPSHPSLTPTFHTFSLFGCSTSSNDLTCLSCTRSSLLFCPSALPQY